MAKMILTKEARLADRILRCLPKQKEVASKLGISQQAVSYKINHSYQKDLVEFIKIVELAGYEIRERY